MKKHAYLIIAHNNFKVLETLIQMIDDKRNDIYIHIDKKATNFNSEHLKKLTKESKIYFTKRMKIYWGNYSQIQCTLMLFREAIVNKYCYYHLISGVDLPIKSQDYIHKFFEENKGKNFIGFTEKWNNERVDKIYIFNKFYKNKNKYVYYVTYKLREMFLDIQRKINYKKTKKYNLIFKKGTNWVSINHDCAKYIVENDRIIKKIFKHSLCGDEHFIQTLIYNSPLKNTIYNLEDDKLGCMRYIDWQRGNPYVFKTENYKELMESNKLFARKFDEKVDFNITQKIFHGVK